MAREAVSDTPVVETVSRRRVIPSQELKNEEKATAAETPEFWQYTEGLTREDWGNHVLYVYRLEPRLNPSIGEPAYVDRTYDGDLEMPNGQRVPFSVEALKDKFGGRLFNLLLRRGRQIITTAKVAIEAPPKYPESATAPGGAAVSPSGDASAAAAIGTRAIDALSGQESAAIGVAMNVLRAAADVLTKQREQNPDPVRDKVVALALERFLTPAPQSSQTEMIALFTQMKALFTPPAAPTNTVKEVVETISALKGAGLIPAGGDRTNMGIELARQIPTVANALKDVMREWRGGMEAQRDIAAMSRGGVPTKVYASAPPAHAAPPAAMPPAPPAAEANSANAGATEGTDPPIEWVEDRIVKILRRNTSVSEAADGVVGFLDEAYPAIIGELLAAGPGMIQAGVIPPSNTPIEAGILYLFQNRPILKQIPVNPRLVEFIRTFVEYAKKVQKEPLAGPAPAVEEPRPSA